MTKSKVLFLLAAWVLIGTACEKNATEYREAAANPQFIHQGMEQLTDALVYDIFSPPVASRCYAYPTIAAYEALLPDHPAYATLAGQLHGLSPVPQPDPGKTYCYPLAAMQAFSKVAQSLVFSEERIEALRNQYHADFKKAGVPSGVFENSVAYGDQVADHILTWMNKDMYKETRTFPRFTVNEDSNRWQPTPPDYMEPIEPSWSLIRTMVIDSSSQFKPAPPSNFDLDPGSPFYKELMEVYHAVTDASPEDSAIAMFWDCNPYVSHHAGHVMYATKKITPGGHWIGITAIATQKSEADLMESVEAYTRVSIALFDAFISCWDEKYRSNLIRPETVINQYIDKDWLPILQTPPFPEYTSGHSVVSGAAAITLTELYGDAFFFVDTTEVEYGLPARTFNSFLEASDEAAVSRLYGGIHYMPAITNGVEQGRNLGRFVVKNLKTRKEEAVAGE